MCVAPPLSSPSLNTRALRTILRSSTLAGGVSVALLLASRCPLVPPHAVDVPIGNSLTQTPHRIETRLTAGDTDGDGEVSRAEFHRAMPELGFDAPKEAVDALFDEWDRDGGGSLDLKELQKVLRATPAVTTAVAVAGAASKLKKGSKGS